MSRFQFLLLCLAVLAAHLTAPARAFATPMYNPGDILFVDEVPLGGGAQRVMAIDPDTLQVSTVSVGGLIFGSRGITLDSNGDILVSANPSGANKIVRIDAETGAQSVVAAVPLGGGDIHSLDRQETSLFAAVSEAHGFKGVLEIDLVSGAVTTLTSGGFLEDPRGVAVEGPNTLLVTDAETDTVLRVQLASGFQSIVASGMAFEDVTDVVMANGIPTFAVFNLGVVQLDPVFGPTLISSGEGFKPLSIDVLLNGDLVVTDGPETSSGGSELFIVDPSTGIRQSLYESKQLYGVVVVPIPEPSTALLLGLGLAGLAVRRRRRRE